MVIKGYDILGNIAVVKFSKEDNLKNKTKLAEEFLDKNKNVKSVLDKASKFKGRLRTNKTNWIAGEKTKEALYKENGCEFRFNIDSCYFSPRLASERKEISNMIKKGEKVLVMFGGVAPYAIVIAKNSKPEKVVSVELGRECTKYAVENVKRNKLVGKVEVIQGDVRKVIGKNKKVNDKFDRIIMARPNLKDSFLDVAFLVIKKNGIIHYYGFYPELDLEKMNGMIINESKKAKKKIKITRIKKAGEIGVKKYRYRADLKVN